MSKTTTPPHVSVALLGRVHDKLSAALEQAVAVHAMRPSPENRAAAARIIVEYVRFLKMGLAAHLPPAYRSAAATLADRAHFLFSGTTADEYVPITPDEIDAIRNSVHDLLSLADWTQRDGLTEVQKKSLEIIEGWYPIPGSEIVGMLNVEDGIDIGFEQWRRDVAQKLTALDLIHNLADKRGYCPGPCPVTL